MSKQVPENPTLSIGMADVVSTESIQEAFDAIYFLLDEARERRTVTAKQRGILNRVWSGRPKLTDEEMNYFSSGDWLPSPEVMNEDDDRAGYTNQDVFRAREQGHLAGVEAEKARIREVLESDFPAILNAAQVDRIIDGDEKPEKPMDFEPDTTGAVHAPSYNQGVRDENERIRRGINVFDLPCKKVVMEVIEGDA